MTEKVFSFFLGAGIPCFLSGENLDLLQNMNEELETSKVELQSVITI